MLRPYSLDFIAIGRGIAPRPICHYRYLERSSTKDVFLRVANTFDQSADHVVGSIVNRF